MPSGPRHFLTLKQLSASCTSVIVASRSGGIASTMIFDTSTADNGERGDVKLTKKSLMVLHRVPTGSVVFGSTTFLYHWPSLVKTPDKFLTLLHHRLTLALLSDFTLPS